MAVLMRGDGYF